MPTITISERTGADFTGISSANLRLNAPTTNFLNGSAFEVTEYSPGDYKHNLFIITNTTGISGSVTVSGATFDVRCADNGGDATQDFALHNVTAAAVDAEATWLNRTTLSTWTVPGCFTVGQVDSTDVNTTPVASVSNMATGVDTSFTSATLDGLFEDLLNGDIGEIRLLMVKTDAVNDFKFTEYRGTADTTLGPIITIPYTVVTGPSVDDVSSASADEGDSVVHTVTLSEETTETTNFGASIAGSGVHPAVDGVNFDEGWEDVTFSNGVTHSSGDLVVPSGVTTFTVTIPTIQDGVSNEDLTYTLTVGSVEGIGTIVDIDPLPTASVNDATQDGSTVTFTVTLSAGSGRTITIDWETEDGSKTAGVDYEADSGTLTFDPWETTKDVVITVL